MAKLMPIAHSDEPLACHYYGCQRQAEFLLVNGYHNILVCEDHSNTEKFAYQQNNMPLDQTAPIVISITPAPEPEPTEDTEV